MQSCIKRKIRGVSRLSPWLYFIIFIVIFTCIVIILESIPAWRQGFRIQQRSDTDQEENLVIPQHNHDVDDKQDTDNDEKMNTEQSIRQSMPSSKDEASTTTSENSTRKIQSSKTHLMTKDKWVKSCDDCFYPEMELLVQNNDICNGTNTEFLILITSPIWNMKNRKVIRNTWASMSKGNQGNIRYAFLLGTAPLNEDEVVNDTVLKIESYSNKDILQGQFIDNAENILLKTLMGFNWAIENCNNARYIMKTTDETFVNTKALDKHLDKMYHKDLETHMGGFCWERGKFVVRNPKKKDYVPQSIYSEHKYPPFCSGVGYISKLANIKKILTVSRNTPFFQLEDVYIGVCLQKVGLKVMTIKGFHDENGKINPKNLCIYMKSDIYTIYGLTHQQMYDIWEKKC